MTFLGARSKDTYHSGLLLVYFAALSVTELAVFQLPRAVVLPNLYVVVFSN